MSAISKAALSNLYRRGRVTADGLRNAVEDGVITAAEYQEITGATLPETEG